MVAHDVEQHERVLDVVVVVLDGLVDRFVDGLEAGEVDHAIDMVGVEDLVHGLAVQDVCLIEGEVLGGLVAHDGLDAVDGDSARVGKIVNDDNLVAALEELDDGVGADESGATGDEDADVLGLKSF